MPGRSNGSRVLGVPFGMTSTTTCCLTRPCDPAPRGPDVELQALEPGDRAAVLEVFAGLSARSRELRFLTAKPRLTAADLRQLTAVDHRDHVAILAVSSPDGRRIGIARFVRDRGRSDSADVAVAVVDAWQGRGVGTMLATALVDRAREVGVSRFTMTMSRENAAAMRLAHHPPGEIERLVLDRDVAELAITWGALSESRDRGLDEVSATRGGRLAHLRALLLGAACLCRLVRLDLVVRT